MAERRPIIEGLRGVADSDGAVGDILIAPFFGVVDDSAMDLPLRLYNGRLRAGGAPLGTLITIGLDGRLEHRTTPYEPRIKLESGRFRQMEARITPPTFVDIGNTSIGTDTFPPSDGRVMITGPWSVPANCEVESIFVRQDVSSAGTGNVYGVVFLDDGAGLPTGSPLAVGGAVASPVGGAWLESIVAGSAPLVGGTQVHIGYFTNGVYNSYFDHLYGAGAMRRYEGYGGSGPLGAIGDTYVSTLSAYARCSL